MRNCESKTGGAGAGQGGQAVQGPDRQHPALLPSQAKAAAVEKPVSPL